MESSFFLSSLITLLTFFSYIFLFFLHFIFHYYDKWICTVTPMPIRVGRVFRKRVTYNQIRFWTIHPSPLKSFLHVKVYFLACLCNWLKSPSWCSAVDRSDPHQSQITRSTRVFSVGHVGHGQIFILWKPISTAISTHKLQNGLLSHTALFQKTWGKSSTLRTQARVSVKPISFVLVANAMSVCNLVSTLMSWVCQGSCFCFINVLFLSLRWQWWWAGAWNTGVHCELTVASLSSSG